MSVCCLISKKRQERYTSNAPIVALVQETVVLQKFQRANVHTSPFASKSKHCYVELITKQFAFRCKINEGETAGKMRLRVLLESALLDCYHVQPIE